jgi:hypothetical protein
MSSERVVRGIRRKPAARARRIATGVSAAAFVSMVAGMAAVTSASATATVERSQPTGDSGSVPSQGFTPSSSYDDPRPYGFDSRNDGSGYGAVPGGGSVSGGPVTTSHGS